MSIGEPVARLDGPAKVTGAARYAAGLHAEVVVEGQSSPAGASDGSGAATPEVARAR